MRNDKKAALILWVWKIPGGVGDSVPHLPRRAEGPAQSY